MIFTLNTVSGVLHASPRCAGADTRFHYRFHLAPGDRLIGFLYYRFTGPCRKCLSR